MHVCLWIGGMVVMAAMPQPGERMPEDVRARVDRAVDALREAMVRRDQERVDLAVGGLREAYGDWLGVPERKPVYAAAPDLRAAMTEERLRALWRRAWAEGIERHPVPDFANPKAKHPLLRFPAYVVLGGLAALEKGIGDRDEIEREVRDRLEYLLAVQRADGLFPFADLRGTDTKFAALLENHYRLWPEDFENGFVIEDHLDGGLQFDNGVCAVAMIRAYDVLTDKRYRRSAKAACDWTIKRPVVVNWNYNAFSVWALASYVRATGDRALIRPAIERLKLGVLPGQLPSGRWMDPHNARTVYHAILLRAMAELFAVLPEDEPVRRKLKEAVEKADRVLVEEIRVSGVTDADHSLSALRAVERAFGCSSRRAQAITVIGNAMYAELVDPGDDVIDDLTLFAVGELLKQDQAVPKDK